ncbi:hypothetical protein ACRAWD_11650 [Caulobacter segnis]
MSLTGVAALRAALAGQEAADPAATVAAFLSAHPGFTADEHALNDWGYRLLAFGKPRSALAVLETDGRSPSDQRQRFRQPGEAYAVNGDKASALVAYRRSLALDPDEQQRRGLAEASGGTGPLGV